jgi:hypothetical protein
MGMSRSKHADAGAAAAGLAGCQCTQLAGMLVQQGFASGSITFCDIGMLIVGERK